MRGFARAFFGAHGQGAFGVSAFAVGLCFWVLGTWKIPGALAPPWDWAPVAFVFHVSMFYGQVACYSIVSGALGYRATERVESVVADVVDVEHADEVNVG